jgi:hypothetical protein
MAREDTRQKVHEQIQGTKYETSIALHNKVQSTGRRHLGRMSKKWLEEYRIWTIEWSIDANRYEEEEEDDDNGEDDSEDDEYVDSLDRLTVDLRNARL